MANQRHPQFPRPLEPIGIIFVSQRSSTGVVLKTRRPVEASLDRPVEVSHDDRGPGSLMGVGTLTNPQTNDKVSIHVNKSEIPVGGRLTHFLGVWQKITTDQWVLDIIEKGHKLEFNQIPIFKGIKHTVVPKKHHYLILKEIENLLEKNVIEKVPQSQMYEGFYSTLFLVPKRLGK